MRESIAEIERIMVTLHKEINFDQHFLNGLLDHKNNTMAWLRERQTEEMERIRAVYDDMVSTMMKEVEILEKHLATYEKGTPNDKRTISVKELLND